MFSENFSYLKIPSVNRRSVNLLILVYILFKMKINFIYPLLQVGSDGPKINGSGSSSLTIGHIEVYVFHLLPFFAKCLSLSRCFCMSDTLSFCLVCLTLSCHVCMSQTLSFCLYVSQSFVLSVCLTFSRSISMSHTLPFCLCVSHALSFCLYVSHSLVLSECL